MHHLSKFANVTKTKDRVCNIYLKLYILGYIAQNIPLSAPISCSPACPQLQPTLLCDTREKAAVNTKLFSCLNNFYPLAILVEPSLQMWKNTLYFEVYVSHKGQLEFLLFVAVSGYLPEQYLEKSQCNFSFLI